MYPHVNVCPPRPHVVFQGTNASALEKDIGPEQFPINEHYFGLVNVSITESLIHEGRGAAKTTGVSFIKTERPGTA